MLINWALVIGVVGLLLSLRWDQEFICHSCRRQTQLISFPYLSLLNVPRRTQLKSIALNHNVANAAKICRWMSLNDFTHCRLNQQTFIFILINFSFTYLFLLLNHSKVDTRLINVSKLIFPLDESRIFYSHRLSHSFWEYLKVLSDSTLIWIF